MPGFNELNSKLYQESVPVESGKTYRLQCDYRIQFKLPSDDITPYIFKLGTDENGAILTVDLTGIGDELVTLGPITSAGDTFVASGSSVAVYAHILGFHMEPLGYEYMLADVTNISLKEVV